MLLLPIFWSGSPVLRGGSSKPLCYCWMSFCVFSPSGSPIRGALVCGSIGISRYKRLFWPLCWSWSPHYILPSFVTQFFVIPVQEDEDVGAGFCHLFVDQIRQFKVHVQALPNIKEIMDGKVSFSDIRDLDIEDMLGWEPVKPNELLLGRTAVGKTVLVTGVGGSIGSQLCRQIMHIGAHRLILFYISEFSLYTINHELQRKKRRTWPLQRGNCSTTRLGNR